MTDRQYSFRTRLKPLAASLVALTLASPALAAPPAEPSAQSLLEAMVASGVITSAQANNILADARARDAAKAAHASSVAAPAAANPPTNPPPANPSPDGAVHVQYVPKIVRDQIKDEVKQEVMAQAKQEGWAAPGQIPDWTQHIQVSGDVRVRTEDDMFPKGNVTGPGEQINFGALNTRSTPLDVANLTNGAAISNAVPYYDIDKSRQRERLRARLAVDADLGDGFTTGVRLATGESSSPVSTNQTLGNSGGDFSKYQMWLDRAFIRYTPVDGEAYGLTASAGRFANPFFSTDMIWNNDLNFDGFTATGRTRVASGVTPFLTVGAFPVYNTAIDASTYDTAKTSSHDKWLFAAQGGSDWKAAPATTVKAALAYYYFDNIEGRQQTCYYADQTCGSDLFRPSFAQHGNSYMDLRNNVGRISVSDANYQYFGLATGFHELALTGRLDYDGLKPIFPAQALRVSLDGEYVKNLAFNKGDIAAKAVENNLANGNFTGGDTAAMVRLTAGTPGLARAWDWNVSLAYKYIESDAVVDAFNDSDFGLGGTNLKGYVLGGNLALSKNVWTTLRWLSADAVSGAPFSEDAVMLDLNAKF